MIRSSKTLLHTLVACVCLCFVASSSLWAVVIPGQTIPKATKIPGRLTVQFEDNVNTGQFQRGFGTVSTGISSVDQVLVNFSVSNVRPVFTHVSRPALNSGQKDLTRYYEITFPDSIPLADVQAALSQNPNVRMSEPVWEYYTEVTPNDPQYTSQWNMAPPGPDPQLYNAWGLETGSDSIKVAIVDTGVLYKHPDLIGNIWVNPGEDINHNGVVWDVDDLNGIDDDGNGFVDDLIGYDFVTSIDRPYPGEDGVSRDNDPSDFWGHGTHCAGIVAAMNNNGTNVCGVAGGWFGGNRATRGIRIMCCRAGGGFKHGDTTGGSLSSNDLADAINYATMMHANAINASWGGGGFSSPLLTAINDAVLAGITFAHSAGNDGLDNIGYEDQVAGVISVAATTSSDTKASFSNFGAWVDVSAPGQGILSTVSNFYTPGTAVYDGTSMAAPHVAGLSALIRSMMPSLTRQQADSILIHSADNINAQNPSYIGKLGSGRINAYKALQNLANAKFAADVTEGNVPLPVSFTDNSPNSPTSWDWNLGDGTLSTTQNPAHTYTTPGIYSVGLKIMEPNGLGEEYLNNYLWVRADTLKLDSTAAEPGTEAVLNVYFRNSSPMEEMTLPFAFGNNTQGVDLDSYSVAGTRSVAFDQISLPDQNPEVDYAISMIPSPAGHTQFLAAGGGTLIKLYFKIPAGATRGTVITLDTVSVGFGGSTKPKTTSLWGTYWPVFKPGKIVIGRCTRGKVLCGTGVINLGDLSALVSFLGTGSPTLDLYGGNVNGVGIIDLSDLTYLVAYLTGSGAPPPTN